MALASSSTFQPSDSSSTQPKSKPQPKSELPLFRYPPFPPSPPDVKITPYAHFHEYGIRLYGLPSAVEGDPAGDIEIDGLGIPTLTLRVRHETDRCKSFTRGREKIEHPQQRKAKPSQKEKKIGESAPMTKKDPILRALEQRQQRGMLFAAKEWYEQWAEGEPMRGTTAYDKDSTIVDRVHSAANDFRKGRVWPLASSGLGYLWDQFRLYVGLLGQPPVWYRTDLQQNPDDIVDGMEADDEAPFEKGAAAPQTDDQKKDKNIFDDFYDEDIEVDEPTRTQPTSGVENSSRPMQRKRVPPRTPYALHNIVPAALSSSSQVKTLLSIAQVRKHQKLESFIYTPDISLRIFFSWYPHHQGFIFSPSTLINLPRLVLFFLEFLVRTKAVYESDQALKAAVELTKKAVTELPATGKLCKLLPDKMGLGCSLLWGKRWIEEDQPFRLGEKREEEARQEAEKKFEEELKNENVQVMSSERILRQEKEFNSAIEKDSNDDEDDSRAEISIQILSPTSPAFSNSAETPTAFIEEVVAKSTISTQKAEERTPAVQDAPSANADLTTKSATAHAPWMVNKETLPHPESEQCLSIPPRWDANPDDPPSAHDRLRLDAWVPKVGQPLMALFGMTVLPLKYKAEVAERSMRRVKEVIPAGGKSKEAGMERRWRSVQEDLVEKLARVVLEPWLDWDDGGIAPTYRRPRVQISPEVQRAAEQDPNISRVQEEKPRGQEQLHDPEKDVIVILIENRVAEQISVGMGLAGTWVQMVRIQDYRKEAGISAVDVTEGGGHEGYSRGRGRGRGRGGATCGGKGKEDKTGTDPDSSATIFSHIEAADQAANDSLSERQIARKEETSTQGARRGWRGRGRGRGGHHHSGGFEKEFVFWYVEDIVVAIPSFWMAGKEEEPIRLPEGEEEQDFELSDLED